MNETIFFSRWQWSDIEEDRRIRRLDGHPCPVRLLEADSADSPTYGRPGLTEGEVRAMAAKACSYRDGPTRTWAKRWLVHCLTDGPRPRPDELGLTYRQARRVELALARLGAVDPAGFDGLLRRPSKKRRAPVGRVPEEFARIREAQLEHDGVRP